MRRLGKACISISSVDDFVAPANALDTLQQDNKQKGSKHWCELSVLAAAANKDQCVAGPLSIGRQKM
jgi:hypothetical protein